MAQLRLSTASESMSDEPVLRNIKVHFRVKTAKLPKFKIRIEELDACLRLNRHVNFFVFKKSALCEPLFTYTFFPTNGYINSTGLRSFANLSQCLAECAGVLHLSVADFHDFKIDNITASGAFETALNLGPLTSFLQKCDYSCQSSNNFPGIVLRFPGRGTILLFSSGKYTIVGLKCLHSGVLIVRAVRAAIQKSRTMGKDLKFVQAVDFAHQH